MYLWTNSKVLDLNYYTINIRNKNKKLITNSKYYILPIVKFNLCD